MNKILIALALSVSLTGCASIMGKNQYPVNISSSPEAASYTITNRAGQTIQQGMTPETITLKSSAGYFKGERYLLTFNKPGHEQQQFTLDSGISGWYAGNILFGGPLGLLIIDPATGSMFTLPEAASVNLKPLKNEHSLKITTTDQLSAEQMKKLKPINAQ